MSDSHDSLRRKIDGAGELESVVRTMKALAASSIGQYERAVRSLADYTRTIELGLVVCFRQGVKQIPSPVKGLDQEGVTGAVVFGSDLGLVGQFNEALADYTLDTLRKLPENKRIYAVGERIYERLADAGMTPAERYPVPNSVNAITPLVRKILMDCEAHPEQRPLETLYLFRNRPKSGAIYEPAIQRLLPMDEKWLKNLGDVVWPSKNLPEVFGPVEPTLLALVHEYLFVSLFRACSESLASENAARLAAMQRTEKNIGDLLEELTRQFHRLRQSTIDEELFDVISGFEALNGSRL